MKVEKRSLSDIRENSINTRIHNPKQIQEFKKIYPEIWCYPSHRN